MADLEKNFNYLLLVKEKCYVYIYKIKIVPTRPDFVLPFTDTDFFPPGRTDTETDTDFF